MSVDVNKEAAMTVLREAFEDSTETTDSVGKIITGILRGTHKTYKYVLFTAILAKATNEDIDTLSIQAEDDSVGAYDARSLCHKVVVPFEREYVPHSLGDSNEPYLNKPARFVRISLDNAVRSGNDKDTLSSLVGVLPLINTQKEAFKYLSSAIAVLKQISQEYEQKFEVKDIQVSDENIQAILDFIDRATERACEGETCPLIVSSLESVCFPRHKVVAHNVNECGASSKEVGDIDIYKESSSASRENDWILTSSIEVKDKDFSEQDLQHAISKFRSANISHSLFVYGKKANFDGVVINQLAARYGRLGTYCAVISIMDYSKLRLYNSPYNLTLSVFIESVFEYAKMINAKEETLVWLKSCLDE